jgi:putative transposase
MILMILRLLSLIPSALRLRSDLASENLARRRECHDHIIVLGKAHLRRIIRRFLSYYHGARTHLALHKDAPEPRSVPAAEHGPVIEFPEVGGLQHGYERRAA